MTWIKWATRHNLLTPARQLEWYPPFWLMRIKVLELSDDWRRVRIRLPLKALSKNPGGSMFGGFQASLADPIATLSCGRVFPEWAVWTRALALDFQREGRTDLELRFELDSSQEQSIREQLETKGRATPQFEYGYYLSDGTRCTRIVNTVAIRPHGYTSRKRECPAVADEDVYT